MCEKFRLLDEAGNQESCAPLIEIWYILGWQSWAHWKQYPSVSSVSSWLTLNTWNILEDMFVYRWVSIKYVLWLCFQHPTPLCMGLLLRIGIFWTRSLCQQVSQNLRNCINSLWNIFEYLYPFHPFLKYTMILSHYLSTLCIGLFMDWKILDKQPLSASESTFTELHSFLMKYFGISLP